MPRNTIDLLGLEHLKQHPTFPSSPQELYPLTMPILDLPNELLLIISEALAREDLHSLYQTNRRFRILLTSLLFAGIDPLQVLHWAAETAHETLLLLAIYNGAAVSAQTAEYEHLTAKDWAVIKYNNLVLELRLQASADKTCFDVYRLNALHRAALAGHESIVWILLGQGPDVLARTSRGDTPLHCASASGHVAVVEILLGGVDIDDRGWRGCTPLHFAAMQGHEDVVRLLIVRGADLEARNDEGATPLHVGAWRGHVGIVRMLLGGGADVAVRDSQGCTALQHAAKGGREEVAVMLLAAGADLRLKDESGKTAFGVAYANGHRDMACRVLRTGERRWSLAEWVHVWQG